MSIAAKDGPAELFTNNKPALTPERRPAHKAVTTASQQ
jgi:hypothetical protein